MKTCHHAITYISILFFYLPLPLSLTHSNKTHALLYIFTLTYARMNSKTRTNHRPMSQQNFKLKKKICVYVNLGRTTPMLSSPQFNKINWRAPRRPSGKTFRSLHAAPGVASLSKWRLFKDNVYDFPNSILAGPARGRQINEN